MAQMIINSPVLRTLSRAKEKNGIEERTLIGELFPDTFMKEHTRFSSIEELFESGSFVSLNQTPSDEDIDGHVFITTDFNSWEEMADAAAKEYCAKDRNGG